MHWLVIACLVFVSVSVSATAKAQLSLPQPSDPAALKEAYRLYQESLPLLTTDAFGALKRMQRAVALAEKTYAAEDLHLASYYEELARTYVAMGNSAMQKRYLERAIALREKAPFGGASTKYGSSPEQLIGNDLMQLAMIYSTRSDFAQSEPLFRRALEFYEKAFGQTSLQYANLLIVQAASFSSQRDYPRAQQLIERSLAIYEKLPNGNPVMLLSPLSQLAYVCQQRGNYTAAETHMKRIIRLIESDPHLSNGPGAGSIALHYDELAKIYTAQGRSLEVAALYKKSEAILLSALQNAEQNAQSNPNFGNAMIAANLSYLQMHYQQRGMLEKQQSILERHVELFRKQFGPEHRATSGQEQLLGMLLLQRGDLQRARPLLQHAHQVELKAVGRDLAIGAILPLAEVEHALGHYAEALRMTGEARTGFTHRLGLTHPILSILRLREARLQVALEQIPQALATLHTTIENTEPILKLLLSSGTEQDKRRILAGVASQVHTAVDLHVRHAPSDAEAMNLAFTSVLRRKGRAIDAFSDSLSALQKRLTATSKTKLEQLSAARAMLSKLVLHSPQDPPPEYAQQIAELEETIRRLEEELFTESPEIKLQSQVVTADAVRAALPADSALVEIFAYQPDDPRQPKTSDDANKRRYVAYVQTAKGSLHFYELGATSDIDQQIKQLREALISASRLDVKALGRALYEKVLQPLRPYFGDAKHLFLSPDGALNLVPFGALVGEDGQYLIQRYNFTYLSSGRDLIRLRAQLQNRDKTVIIANPTFGEPLSGQKQEEAQSGPVSRGRRSSALKLSTNWQQLPATSEEAKTVAELLGDAEVLSGPKATESTLKRLSGPRVLHVATHGFFLPSEKEDSAKEDSARENPLLRSGLILAGANQRESGLEDGVLTALEASGLDLGGTQLVVLSACETGLGQIQSGDGVYGLRRALVMAGAETQIMSLWQVDDNATRDLMIGFYRRLRQGKGRSEALRQAQLKLLESSETQHPFYWASFIPAGDWQPMRETPAPSPSPAATP